MACWNDEYGEGNSRKVTIGVTALIGLGALFALLALVFSTSSSSNSVTLLSQIQEINNQIDQLQLKPADGSTPAPGVPETCSQVKPISDRFDCHPELDASLDRCSSRGCCWDDKISLSNLTKDGDIACYFPDNYLGYKITSNSSGDNKLLIRLSRWTPSGFPKEVQNVIVEVFNLDESRLRIKITDEINQRFEPQLPIMNINQKLDKFEAKYNVHLSKDGNLIISRKSTKVEIVKINLNTIIFTDQFLSLSSIVPARSLFGLGEHFNDFKINLDKKQVFTMFNSDRSPSKNKPLYGTHPFFIQIEDNDLRNSNTYGFLSFNNHPQDIIVDNKPSVTIRTTGGIFDIFVTLGDNPEEVIKQHISLVGKPDLPPFWSLGWHLCKYGYVTLNHTRDIFEKTRQAGIPFDVQWNDIDTMNNFESFTYDKITFAGLPEFINELHELGMKYVPIIDPAIEARDSNYAPFAEGLAEDIFVKNSSDKLFLGKVWNVNASAFPDFTNPKVNSWWARQIRRYHEVINFDGLWLDMNEPANIISGNLEIGGCAKSDYDNPPYLIGDHEDPLWHKTICMNSKHYIGTHSDVHNMYAIYEVKATKEALRAVRKERQFIISRASVTGQGAYGMHWTGDVKSDWESMRQSISGIFQMGLVGMPQVGADICGFTQSTTVELCSRWSALGAFYPFSRNHNDLNSVPQDPVSLGPQVVEATKKNNLIRYSLLPYLYTLFYEASKNGATVFRPMVYEFPLDKLSYEYVNEQFMWGSGLLFIQVWKQGTNITQGYFPPAKWYNFKNGEITNGAKVEQLTIPPSEINIYQRGGSILPMQAPAMTTTETRKNDFKLMIALDDQGQAQGQLFWDDGKSFDTLLTGDYNLFSFKVQDSTFTSKVDFWEYKDQDQNFIVQEIVILGIGNDIKNVKLDNYDIKDWSWKDNKLTITAKVDLKKDVKLTWSQ